jgi:hypothetical protein
MATKKKPTSTQVFHKGALLDETHAPPPPPPFRCILITMECLCSRGGRATCSGGVQPGLEELARVVLFRNLPKVTEYRDQVT